MKFGWERESEEGFCKITAVPGEYDGYPKVDSLTMDSVPRLVSDDRLAAACVLGYYFYVSGTLQLPSKISPEMASAISELVRPGNVTVENIDYTPKAISYGMNTYCLALGGKESHALEWNGLGSSREFGLTFVPMAEAYSSSVMDDSLRVPSNADQLVPNAVTGDEFLIPYIGQAVLLSEDLDVGIIRLPRGINRSDKLSAVGEVLRTCGMVLQFSE